MNEFFKKIFHFEPVHGGLRHKLTILGIKITIPTLKTFLSKRQDPFYYYKKNNFYYF